MKSLTIRLPDDLFEWLESQKAQGRTKTDVILSLLRSAQGTQDDVLQPQDSLSNTDVLQLQDSVRRMEEVLQDSVRQLQDKVKNLDERLGKLKPMTNR